MGTKKNWTDSQTKILAEVATIYTPTSGDSKMPHEWTKIAEEFNFRSG
jgi:hypothetical protein